MIHILTYDNSIYFLSFPDGDLWRLFRFREAIQDRAEPFQVVCFQEQIPLLKSIWEIKRIS